MAYNWVVRVSEGNVRIKGECMSRVLGSVMLILGMSTALMAQSAPEIDASSGVSALALLAGAVLVFQTRRKK